MNMEFITNLFGKGTQSQLEQIAREVKPIFQTSEGRDEVIRSILFSEFPFTLSEYVFEIKDKQFTSLTKFNNERIKFLTQIFQGGMTKEDMRQYSNYKNSAILATPSNNNAIFHTHPRDSPEWYSSADAPHFSKADKKFSKKSPLGLVEYCLVDPNKIPIHLSSRLSLCYKGQVRTFLEMGVDLNSNGSYSSNDGEVEYSGRIPVAAHATGKVVDFFIQEAEDRLTKYALQHSIIKL